MKGNTRGFTLLELLVVVVIIGILATLATIRFQKAPLSAQAAEAYANLGTLADSQFRYKAENGKYADVIADLDTDNPNDMKTAKGVDDACTGDGKRRFGYVVADDAANLATATAICGGIGAEACVYKIDDERLILKTGGGANCPKP